jgi:hypothetical protein
VRKFWILLAALLAALAAVFAVLRDFDKAFVLAAAGAVSWFLSYRVELRQLVDPSEQHKRDDIDSTNEDDN